MRRENLSIKSGEKNQLLTIEHGGTSSQTNSGALLKLGALNPSVINQPGGVVGLNADGHLDVNLIPTNLGTINPVNIQGPETVQVTGAVFCYITNYDDFTNYVIDSQKVTVTREGNILAVQGEIEGNDAWFSINGSKFYLTVTAAPLIETGNGTDIWTVYEQTFGATLEISDGTTETTMISSDPMRPIGRQGFSSNSQSVYATGRVSVLKVFGDSEINSVVHFSPKLSGLTLRFNVASGKTISWKTNAQFGSAVGDMSVALLPFEYIAFSGSGGDRIPNSGSVLTPYLDGLPSTVSVEFLGVGSNVYFSNSWAGQLANGTAGAVNQEIIFTPFFYHLFGETVSIARKNENVLAIGSPNSRSYPRLINPGGEVKFFYQGSNVNEAGTQVFGKPLSNPNPHFGSALKINNSGSRALVGSKGVNKVHVFTRTNAEFTESNWFTKSGLVTNAKFGIAITGSDSEMDTVAVGAPGQGVGGSVSIFNWSGTNYTHTVTFSPTNLPAGTFIGKVLTMNQDGNKLYVTAKNPITRDGFIIEYLLVNNVWVEYSRIQSPVAYVSGTNFGCSIDIGGNQDRILAIGASAINLFPYTDYDDPVGQNTIVTGAVHIFVFNNLRWVYLKTISKVGFSTAGAGFGMKTKMRFGSESMLFTTNIGGLNLGTI